MEHGEIQIGNVYISGFNDKEYTHTANQNGKAVLKSECDLEYVVGFDVLLRKYTLKKSNEKK